ncbi:MAG: hypothetical protein ACREX4_20870 [Gammaproteobacteria bacterium]
MTIQVPYLPEEAIECDAERLLAEYAHARGVTLEPPIPIEEIVEKHLKLRIEFDDLHEVLGVPQVGPEPEIFGAIWVDKREICIHERLDPEEHPEIEGGIASRWPTKVAVTGGCTEPTSSPIPRRRRCSMGHQSLPSSADRARRRNGSSGKRIFMPRAF